MKKNKIIAVIPSRYQSSRFPGKPLAMISGQTMIHRVYDRVSDIEMISEVIVATDDRRIYDEVVSFGGKVVMTGECKCGTDRVYQVVRDIDCDVVLNIQGDEPLIKKEMIESLINAFEDESVKMATLRKKLIDESDINNPNIAKVVVDNNNDALIFSRSTVPYNRDAYEGIKYYKHIGVYGYTKDFLKTFVGLPQGMLELSESLEQLRALEAGYKIKVIETEYDSIGVDLPEHIAKIEKELENETEI